MIFLATITPSFFFQSFHVLHLAAALLYIFRSWIPPHFVLAYAIRLLHFACSTCRCVCHTSDLQQKGPYAKPKGADFF
jgi:hypothetical protein